MGGENGGSMMSVHDIIEQERMLAFDRVDLLKGDTLKDCSTIMVTPTRGMIHSKVVQSWANLAAPMNGQRIHLFVEGDEVGIAYNRMIHEIITHPSLSKFKYVLSLEDDNLVPPDAHLKLLQTIAMGPFDVAAGLYWTKGDINMPMAYGDPKKFATSGIMDMRPRDVVEALKTGNIMEVNGVGMGCTLWRIDLFKELAPPWFVTLNEVIPERGLPCVTQDLYFCERLRRASKRVAVDLRVHVGHIDPQTGVVY